MNICKTYMHECMFIYVRVCFVRGPVGVRIQVRLQGQGTRYSIHYGCDVNFKQQSIRVFKGVDKPRTHPPGWVGRGGAVGTFLDT